jgi:RNA polymerase sigma factor (sigma-70 family)
MFLSDEKLVETIARMQQGRGRDKDKAFLELSDAFLPLIKKTFNSVSSVAETKDERDDLQHFINVEFWKILIQVNLEKQVGQIKAFIENTLKFRVNKASVKHELGKSSPIKTIRNYESFLFNKLKEYKFKYKQLPDFKNQDDINRLAELMEMKPDEVERIISTLHFKSLLSDPTAGDDEGNFATLLDSLQSGEQLPDKVLMDKEIMKHVNESLKSLRPEEQQVFKLYFLENEEDKPIDDLAKEIDMDYRKFRHLLAISKEKVKNSPKVQQLINAHLKARIIKLTKNRFQIVKVGSNYQLKKNLLSERIISEILWQKK